MKKMIYITVLLLLILPMIVVAESQQGKVVLTVASQANKFQGQNGKIAQEQIKVIQSEEIEERIRKSDLTFQVESKVKGLENAIIHADSIVASERLQKNLERFQNRYEFKHVNIAATDIDDVTVLKAQRKIKFLFFNFNVKDEYVIDEEGKIIAEQRSFLSKLFVREKTGEEVQ